jgi:hypothetical protein
MPSSEKIKRTEKQQVNGKFQPERQGLPDCVNKSLLYR